MLMVYLRTVHYIDFENESVIHVEFLKKHFRFNIKDKVD